MSESRKIELILSNDQIDNFFGKISELLNQEGLDVTGVTGPSPPPIPPKRPYSVESAFSQFVGRLPAKQQLVLFRSVSKGFSEGLNQLELP